MLWSAVDSLGIYFWFDINLKEISFILLPWTFFGFFLPAMEERKAAKALSFSCHFSQTGTIRFFYCFFGRRLTVLPSIELAPIFEHMNELFTISSWIFLGRKLRELTATPCPENFKKMLFWRPILPLPSNHCFAIYQKSDFNRSKSHLNSFTFHEVFLLTQDHIFCSDSYRGSVKFYRDTTQILWLLASAHSGDK